MLSCGALNPLLQTPAVEVLQSSFASCIRREPEYYCGKIEGTQCRFANFFHRPKSCESGLAAPVWPSAQAAQEGMGQGHDREFLRSTVRPSLIFIFLDVERPSGL